MIFWTIVLAVIAGSALTALALAHRHAWRWGEVEVGAVHAGEGAYRGVVLKTTAPRGTPALVPWSAGTGFVWAAITFFVFAPAGLLLSLLAAEQLGGVAALWVALVSLSGFAIAVALVVAGVSLLRCRPGADRRAKSIATWSIGHHLVVFSTMLALGFAERGWLEIMIWTAGPCIVGVVHALALRAAGELPGPAVLNDDSV